MAKVLLLQGLVGLTKWRPDLLRLSPASRVLLKMVTAAVEQWWRVSSRRLEMFCTMFDVFSYYEASIDVVCCVCAGHTYVV